jgi:hypothetical protein
MAEFRRLQWQSSYLTFQIYDEDSQTRINLIIEKEHPQNWTEATMRQTTSGWRDSRKPSYTKALEIR